MNRCSLRCVVCFNFRITAQFKFPLQYLYFPTEQKKKKSLLLSCNSGKKPPNFQKYCIIIECNIQDTSNFALKQQTFKDNYAYACFKVFQKGEIKMFNTSQKQVQSLQ